ncbi:MAG: hypothetical protein VYE27_02725 [Pseudomonadota bacterium]|nr:hypothetical protein [Pseudomonadota bacterium]
MIRRKFSSDKEAKKYIVPPNKIVEWLNKKGYLSVRGKKFKGNHVHSIVKKKRLKDDKLERVYPEVRSDFSLEVIDKTLVNI